MTRCTHCTSRSTLCSRIRGRILAVSLASASALAVLSISPAASAQAFGSKGDVSFAADRLMGVYIDDPGAGPNQTVFALGQQPFGGFYDTARLGIDFFVIDHLSIGGSLGYFHVNVDRPRGDTSADGFLFSPRVGYALDFSDSFGFWPRGGFTIRNLEGDDEVALTLEGMFYASPAPHFAFTFGPAFDIGIAGDNDEEQSFGLVTMGILGWI